MQLLKALTLSAAFVFAVEATADELDDARIDYCEKIGNMAMKTMEVRQANVPMSQVMNAVSNDDTRWLIIAAYQQPLRHSEDGKLEAIMTFANRLMSVCYDY